MLFDQPMGRVIGPAFGRMAILTGVKSVSELKTRLAFIDLAAQRRRATLFQRCLKDDLHATAGVVALTVKPSNLFQISVVNLIVAHRRA